MEHWAKINENLGRKLNPRSTDNHCKIYIHIKQGPECLIK